MKAFLLGLTLQVARADWVRNPMRQASGSAKGCGCTSYRNGATKYDCITCAYEEYVDPEIDDYDPNQDMEPVLKAVFCSPPDMYNKCPSDQLKCGDEHSCPSPPPRRGRPPEPLPPPPPIPPSPLPPPSSPSPLIIQAIKRRYHTPPPPSPYPPPPLPPHPLIASALVSVQCRNFCDIILRQTQPDYCISKQAACGGCDSCLGKPAEFLPIVNKVDAGNTTNQRWLMVGLVLVLGAVGRRAFLQAETAKRTDEAPSSASMLSFQGLRRQLILVTSGGAVGASLAAQPIAPPTAIAAKLKEGAMPHARSRIQCVANDNDIHKKVARKKRRQPPPDDALPADDGDLEPGLPRGKIGQIYENIKGVAVMPRARLRGQRVAQEDDTPDAGANAERQITSKDQARRRSLQATGYEVTILDEVHDDSAPSESEQVDEDDPWGPGKLGRPQSRPTPPVDDFD